MPALCELCEGIPAKECLLKLAIRGDNRKLKPEEVRSFHDCPYLDELIDKEEKISIIVSPDEAKLVELIQRFRNSPSDEILPQQIRMTCEKMIENITKPPTP